MACNKGHESLARLLLDYNCDVDRRGPNGATALHEASLRGHVRVVRVLLAAGAKPDVCTAAGQTPADLTRCDAVRDILRAACEGGPTQAGDAADMGRVARFAVDERVLCLHDADGQFYHASVTGITQQRGGRRAKRLDFTGWNSKWDRTVSTDRVYPLDELHFMKQSELKAMAKTSDGPTGGKGAPGAS